MANRKGSLLTLKDPEIQLSHSFEPAFSIYRRIMDRVESCFFCRRSRGSKRTLFQVKTATNPMIDREGSVWLNRRVSRTHDRSVLQWRWSCWRKESLCF